MTTHTPLTLHLRKGAMVVVRLKDHISCGKYRGNGEYWYTYGTVEHVSRRYGYALVSYTDRWGRARKEDIFTWDGRRVDYCTIDSRNRSNITIHRTTDEQLLLPLEDTYADIILRQDLIDQIRETSYRDWERLPNEQLWSIIKLVATTRKKGV